MVTNTATDFCPQPGAGYLQPGASAFALDLAVGVAVDTPAIARISRARGAT